MKIYVNCLPLHVKGQEKDFLLFIHLFIKFEAINSYFNALRYTSLYFLTINNNWSISVDINNFVFFLNLIFPNFLYKKTQDNFKLIQNVLWCKISYLTRSVG